MSLIFKKGVNIREMLSSADTKDYVLKAINTYLLDIEKSPFADLGYKEIFQEFDTNKRSQSFSKGPKFAITWHDVSEGGVPKFSTVSDRSEVEVYAVHWRAALKYLKDWFRYNELPLIEKATDEFRNSAARLLSRVFYGIIVNAGNATGVTADDDNYIAVGDAIESQVMAMRNPVLLANGDLDYSNSCFATHIVCNSNDEGLVKKAIDAIHRAKAMEFDKDIKPLSEYVGKLKVIASDYIPADYCYPLEAKRYFVALKDGELELDTDEDKLMDAETTYGSLRRGGGCLSSNAVRYVRIR